MIRTAAKQSQSSELSSVASHQPRTADMADAARPKSYYEQRSNHRFFLKQRELTGRIPHHVPYFCYRGPLFGWVMLPHHIQCRLRAIDAEILDYCLDDDIGLFDHRKTWCEDLEDPSASGKYKADVRIDYDFSKEKKTFTFDSREIRYDSGELCEVRKQWPPPDDTDIGFWR